MRTQHSGLALLVVDGLGACGGGGVVEPGLRGIDHAE